MGGGGFAGVFRPIVFRVAASEIFANKGVTGGPETFEIAGDLHGTLCGREQVHHHRHASVSDLRRLCQTKHLLNANFHVWRFVVMANLDV